MVNFLFQLHNDMNISMIAAVGKNNELGKDNKLIWRLPEDLKYFRKVTDGHAIIMGRKTFESLPKMLPNRKHIILSSNNNFPSELEVYKSIKELLDRVKQSNEEVFIIGGGSIYEQLLKYTTSLYLTEIDAECPEADVYFPKFNKEEWEKAILNKKNENSINYEQVLYRRKC